MLLSSIAVSCLFLSSVKSTSADDAASDSIIITRNQRQGTPNFRRRTPEYDPDSPVESKAGKSGGGGGGGEGKAGKDYYVDDLCTKFCDEYFNNYCPTNNIYLNPDATYRRRLVTTQESNLPRVDNLPSISEGVMECQRTCMKWPRGDDPELFDPDDVNVGGSIFGGDTLWCRRRHMSLATDLNNAAFHCPHATNPSQGICTDSLVGGYTPYERLRGGQPTRRHFGYCDLADDDKVADCSSASIDLDNIKYALRMMPASVEIIFMNGNVGLSKLEANLFADNLKNPSNIQALYFNDCLLESIDEDALSGLPNLLIFNADSNLITELPEHLLQHTPKLLQLSMFANQFPEIQSKFFSYTPDIERIVLYGNPALGSFHAGTFDGLTKLVMLSFVNCNFTNEGFPPGIFKDLVSLEFFDFFGNQLDYIDAGWFEGGWATNVRRVAMWNNAMMDEIQVGALDTLESMQALYLHGTNITYLDPDLFADKKDFVHLTMDGVSRPA